MKKFAAILLCLVMVFSLTACSSEKDALVGSWEGSFDMTGIMNDAMTAGDPEMAQFVAISDFTLNYTITFGEDDTYSMSADRTVLEATFARAMEEVKTGLYTYVEYLLEQEGVEMSVEEFLTASNMSIDEMMAEAFSEEYINEMVDSIAMKGTFDAKDGKLFLSESYDTVPDPEYYEYYTLEGDTLTIDQGSAQETGEFESLIYPMVLTKVG